MIKKNPQSGYALFTSIILTGMLIIIAYATTNFSIKQLLLTTSGADSHFAFYIADSGVECALYWDIKNGPISAFESGAPTPITCGGSTVTPTQAVNGVHATSTFTIPVSTSCAIVYVAKNGTTGNTTIESRGYNTCTGSNKLERAVRITY